MGHASPVDWMQQRSSGRDEDGSADPIGLLSPDQLQAAIAGHLGHHRRSPLIRWARELGDLHATLLTSSLDPLRRPADFDEAVLRRRVREVVGEIDSWAVFVLPRPTVGARKHTHTLGEVVSHLATAYVDAWWTVLHTSDEQLRHEAWFHLGQLHEGYACLLDDLHARRVELPLGWPRHQPHTLTRRSNEEY
ncbi:hypothetical protein ABZ540_33795 [Nocardia xishanensis]|uniref:hypothetical protein n=1 Tax=Nocardia xishanensis TaxID=238964 RepID=UPI0033DB7784